jgi:methyl-accepting chemotaxis protein
MVSSVAFIVLAIVMLLIETINRDHIIENNFNTLKALREIKSDQVIDYINLSRNQIRTMSENFMVVDAMRSFKKAFHGYDGEESFLSLNKAVIGNGLNEYYGDEFLPRLTPNIDVEVFASNFIPSSPITRALQYQYIASNPNAVGEKEKLVSAVDGSLYSQIHAKYHPGLLSFIEKFGLYDFFLVDSETGHIVYSTFKEVDFGTSLLNGPYSTTSIARLFREARKATFADFVRMVDFQPYIPSYNAPSSFIASPVFDGEENIGVLILQMPVDRINHIMTYDNEWQEVGLGESGETYIVANDFTLRNQSRFLIESKVEYLRAISEAGIDGKTIQKISNFNSSIGLQPVRTEGSIEAVNGNAGEAIFEDYRGVKVLSSYAPLELEDLTWALLSEIDLDEAKKPLRQMRYSGFLVFLLMLPVSFVLGWVVTRSMTARIKSIKHSAVRLAEGDLDINIPVEGNDEISALASSFEKMRFSIRTLVENQSKTIDDLSASLIPLNDDIGVMVLIGLFDDHRLEIVRQKITEDLSIRFHQIVIIDVSNIPNFNEYTGSGIIKIAKTVKLMGCKIILSGIHASMAYEMTNLNIDLQGIDTQNTLQNAISQAMEIINNDTK